MDDIIELCFGKVNITELKSAIVNNRNPQEQILISSNAINPNRIRQLTYRAVERLLLYLSFKTNLIGSRYLCEALTECLLDANRTRKKLSTELYPPIAERHGISVEGVERAIRTAIRDCYDYGDLRKLNDIFNCRIISDKYPPTNSEFISNLTLRLRLALDNDADEQIDEVPIF